MRVPCSDLMFLAAVEVGACLDDGGMAGSDNEAASEGGRGPCESAAVTDAEGARILTFFDFGFLGVLHTVSRARRRLFIDILVEKSDLSTGDVESLLLCLRKKGPLVLRELRVVDKGVVRVVVL